VRETTDTEIEFDGAESDPTAEPAGRPTQQPSGTEFVASMPMASNIEKSIATLDMLSDRDWSGRGVAYICAPAATLGERTDLDRTNSASIRHIVTGAARETVEAEGPIALDRLARVIARRFGFDRVSAARKEFVSDCVPGELIHSGPLGTFVWPHQIDRATWTGYRATPDDVARPLSEVAPEEIVNAMNAACASGELDDESLMRVTMATFNQRRLAGASRDRLEACVAVGLANGRLIRIDSNIRAGS